MVVVTDFLASYRAVIPGVGDAVAGKGAGSTAHIERFWCTIPPALRPLRPKKRDRSRSV
ncbi:hypothetical protein FRUB_01651 [Fimbriiglobus ruber]|uniref:Uncharacterized protein n=1 Tax=Fimbriiglobus ruber TaxID=1908690 RepID=A0A225DUX4_9BACT|nr:hypothetical protein FRUB_01651 [Fimbriiglobus ruber]